MINSKACQSKHNYCSNVLDVVLYKGFLIILILRSGMKASKKERYAQQHLAWCVGRLRSTIQKSEPFAGCQALRAVDKGKAVLGLCTPKGPLDAKEMI